MPRQGRAAERVVEAVERLQSGDLPVKYYCPGFLEDVRTQTQREFDVLIEHEFSGRVYRTCVEVRDRSRSVGTPAVEALKTKLDDCNADKGVLVSTSGFTKPALEKAGQLGIECLTIEQVEQHPWSLMDSVKVIRRRHLRKTMNVVLVPGNELAPGLDGFDVSRVRFEDQRAQEVPVSNLINQAWHAIVEAAPDGYADKLEQVGVLVRSPVQLVTSDEDPLFMLYGESAIRMPVKSIGLVIEHVAEIDLVPLHNVSYIEATTGSKRADAVVSEQFRLGAKNVRFTLGKREDGSFVAKVLLDPLPKDS